MKTQLISSRRQIIIRSIGSLLSIALLIYLLSQQGWTEILEALQTISSRTIIIIVLLMVVSRRAVASRWYSLLHSVAPDISYWESIKLTFAGLFAANFLPTTVGGDILRIAIVVRRARDHISAATSVAADRLVGLVGMAMMTPIGAVQFFGWLSTNSLEAYSVPLINRDSWIMIGVIYGRKDFIGKIARGTRQFVKSLLLWLRRPRALILALSLTWVHMICLFMIIRFLMLDMGVEMPFWTIAGLWSFTYFITLMPFSISGLGLREISISFIFPELGGISVEAALSLGIVLRALDWAISLPGSLFSQNY